MPWINLYSFWIWYPLDNRSTTTQSTALIFQLALLINKRVCVRYGTCSWSTSKYSVQSCRINLNLIIRANARFLLVSHLIKFFITNIYFQQFCSLDSTPNYTNKINMRLWKQLFRPVTCLGKGSQKWLIKQYQSTSHCRSIGIKNLIFPQINAM